MSGRERDDGRHGRLLTLALLGVVLAVAALLIARTALSDVAVLVGTDLERVPAPDFTLTDQHGQTVRLSDFRGKAVALTFIYTHCPDVCPLIAENLRVATELLPAAQRDDVALLAVTLDPARDTPQALQKFTATHRLTDNATWFALRGDKATLEQVWRTYGIFPGTSEATAGAPGTATNGGGMGHTDGIYFIDPSGRQRAFMRSSATPQEIAANLMTMLGE